jgi:hypothetical protein
MRGRIQGQIGAGPEDFSATKSNVLVDGVEYPATYAPKHSPAEEKTIAVDPTKSHNLGLKFSIVNADPGGFPTWSSCVTVYNMTDNTAVNYQRDCTHDGSSGSGDAGINVGTITSAKKFRVKLWANQAGWPMQPAPPSNSYW